MFLNDTRACEVYSDNGGRFTARKQRGLDFRHALKQAFHFRAGDHPLSEVTTATWRLLSAEAGGLIKANVSLVSHMPVLTVFKSC